jgi:hypothetical protein
MPIYQITDGTYPYFIFVGRKQITRIRGVQSSTADSSEILLVLITDDFLVQVVFHSTDASGLPLLARGFESESWCV